MTMATGAIQVPKLHSQCSNCKKIIKDLESLGCSHQFCTHCFQQLKKGEDTNNTIKCSVCINTQNTVIVQQSLEIRKTSVIQSPRITHHNLRNIKTHLKNEVKVITREHAFGRFVNYKDSLWAACHHASCLDVYSYDLDFIKSVPCAGVEKPCTLHPLTSNIMLVGGENGLFEMDTDRDQVRKRILKWEIKDIHINQVLIAVVLQIRINGIRCLELLQQSPSYKLVFRVAHHGALTVLITPDNRVLVSDWNNLITEYNRIGDKITQYNTQVSSRPGELYSPYLCLADIRGNVLMADYCNHRLKVLTKAGIWIVPEKQREILTFPRDITSTDTHLYVNGGNKLHMFAILP